MTLHLSAQVYNHWVADIPHGIDPATLMEPTFWSHHARMMRSEDLVEARAEDGSWRQYFRVRFVEGQEVHLAREGDLIRYVREEGPETDSGPYRTKWISPPCKWGVVNSETGERLQDKFETEEQARRYMRNLSRAHV